MGGRSRYPSPSPSREELGGQYTLTPSMIVSEYTVPHGSAKIVLMPQPNTLLELIQIAPAGNTAFLLTDSGIRVSYWESGEGTAWRPCFQTDCRQ